MGFFIYIYGRLRPFRLVLLFLLFILDPDNEFFGPPERFTRGGEGEDEPFWGSKKFVIWVQNIAQHFTRQGPISSVTSIFRPNRKKLCDTECFVFARFARERTV